MRFATMDFQNITKMKTSGLRKYISFTLGMLA